MDTHEPKPAPPPTEAPEAPANARPPEVGGAKRTTDPTRYNDWEINGKCVDF